MSYPKLTPESKTSAIALPVTGTLSRVAMELPFGIYESDNDFLTGAVDQVSFTYKMLGGDVLDIEITEHNVYAAYEIATLEYSNIVNMHQSKNVLSDLIGQSTASFDSHGEVIDGESLTMIYPPFQVGLAKQVALKASEEANVGGDLTHYSASVSVEPGKQEYNLQKILLEQSQISGSNFFGLVEGNKISIRKIYYKSPRAMWRFYGYYGGLNTVGNLSTYGMYADDATFEVIPAWQNKLQAMNYEDSIYTRISHYSYEIRNNILRIFPYPEADELQKIWIEFVIPDAFSLSSQQSGGVPVNGNAQGVNNMNTLPFANIPYKNINSIGKQWIRRYALAVSKEMLGQVRSKFSTVPIPGESINLNGTELLSQAKEEQNALKEELKTVLNEMTYEKLSETTAGMFDSASRVLEKFPLKIFVG